MPDNRPFIEPTGYTLWDGGNCVWFAWEMAYQRWGVQLPWAGDAKDWMSLDGQTVSVDGQVYEVKVSKVPVPNSLMVFQPDTLEWLYESANNYGHVAWVNQVDDYTFPGMPAWKSINCYESRVWPSKEGNHWHGCWYRDYTYIWPPEGISGVVFLKLDKG